MSVPKKPKPAPFPVPVPVKCYYCRETINLTAQSENLITADHICMSETAKAKRFPQLDEELQKLRARVDELTVLALSPSSPSKTKRASGSVSRDA